MAAHVVILGAGFGGLELSARLSSASDGELHVTLIDRSDSFVFGFSKLDVMFGRREPEAVRAPYRDIALPGVEFRQEDVVSIDPVQRGVVTDRGSYQADVLVVALGADYDPSATPGLDEGGYEFYSVAGAERLRDVLPSFEEGEAVIGVLGTPYKCPPAPYEAAFMLHDSLVERGVRDAVRISVVTPFGSPIPPSPEASGAILAGFAERNIGFLNERLVVRLDPAARVAALRDGGTLPYDLFLGVPVHRVPTVVEGSGLAVDGWIPVDQANLRTRFPGVYAVGDVTSVPVPKAGVFAESAGRAVAADIAFRLLGGAEPTPYDGAGSCYIEFGRGQVGRVDADFLTGPGPIAPFIPPSAEVALEKERFGSTRLQRWFGG